jgi:hypothetical protein
LAVYGLLAAVAAGLLVIVVIVVRARTASPSTVETAPSENGSAFVQPGWRRPAYQGAVGPIPAATAAQMTGVSWRPGCPVPLSELRLIQQSYWGFDHAVHQGELVVHRDVAQALVRVFRTLYDAGVPVRNMRRVESYGGDLEASMANDNTAGFHCPTTGGAEARWPTQAYGRAVDINPVENPQVRDRLVTPPAGAAYLDRHDIRPGMVSPGDAVIRAFAAEGFTWGGESSGGTDYHHFEVGA